MITIPFSELSSQYYLKYKVSVRSFSTGSFAIMLGENVTSSFGSRLHLKYDWYVMIRHCRIASFSAHMLHFYVQENVWLQDQILHDFPPYLNGATGAISWFRNYNYLFV